jgi:hypothetical protein
MRPSPVVHGIMARSAALNTTGWACCTGVLGQSTAGSIQLHGLIAWLLAVRAQGSPNNVRDNLSNVVSWLGDDREGSRDKQVSMEAHVGAAQRVFACKAARIPRPWPLAGTASMQAASRPRVRGSRGPHTAGSITARCGIPPPSPA